MNLPSHLQKITCVSIVLAMLAGILAFPTPVQAGGGLQLFVDTTLDSNAVDYQVCDTNLDNNNCSLRGAIQYVNSLTGSPAVYEIVLGATTYTLTGPADEDLNASGDLDTKPLNFLYITGVSAATTRINGNNMDRVIDHHGPSQLILTDLTVENGLVATGKSGGAGIRNIAGANLWLIRVTVDSNTVDGTNGSQDVGGGIHNEDGTLTIQNSTISNNHAMSGGGLTLGNTNLWMDESAVSFNHATDGSGGGIDTGNGGSSTILRSKILNNTANTAGGLYNNSLGDLNLIDTLVAGNTGISSGGGGGMVLYGTAALDGVTLSGNSVPTGVYGGGMYAAGSITLTNTTITDNTAYWGGGIFIDKIGNVSLNHVTIANNNTLPSGEGSAVFMHDGSTGSGGTFSFQNSIFSSYDPETNTCNKSPSATFTVNDYGYNLFDQTLNCYTHVFTDLTYAYPSLGSLGYYGGWTPTLPLYSFSDAVDAANPAGTLAQDQRNHSRKDGDQNGSVYPDIGAFEYETDVLFLPVIIMPPT